MSLRYMLYKTDCFRDAVRRVAAYYMDHASLKVADQFLTAVQNGITHIETFPHMPPRYTPPPGFEDLSQFDYRMINLMQFSSFPYVIYYEIDSPRLILHAIYHHAQDRARFWDTFGS